MKKNIFTLLPLVLCLTVGLAHENLMARLYVYEMIGWSTVIVYGTVTECQHNDKTMMTSTKVVIKKVIKGKVKGKIFEADFPIYEERRGTNKIYQKCDETKIFFFRKTDNGHLESQFHPVDVINDKVILADTATLSDFKAGVALFDKNYKKYQALRSSNSKMNLKNKSKNQTFAFLIREMWTH